jgi:hypothetical protein
MPLVGYGLALTYLLYVSAIFPKERQRRVVAPRDGLAPCHRSDNALKPLGRSVARRRGVDGAADEGGDGSCHGGSRTGGDGALASGGGDVAPARRGCAHGAAASDAHTPRPPSTSAVGGASPRRGGGGSAEAVRLLALASAAHPPTHVADGLTDGGAARTRLARVVTLVLTSAAHGHTSVRRVRLHQARAPHDVATAARPRCARAARWWSRLAARSTARGARGSPATSRQVRTASHTQARPHRRAAQRRGVWRDGRQWAAWYGWWWEIVLLRRSESPLARGRGERRWALSSGRSEWPSGWPRADRSSREPLCLRRASAACARAASTARWRAAKRQQAHLRRRLRPTAAY